MIFIFIQDVHIYSTQCQVSVRFNMKKSIALSPHSLLPLPIPALQRQHISTSLAFYFDLYLIFLNNMLITLFFLFLLSLLG